MVESLINGRPFDEFFQYAKILGLSKANFLKRAEGDVHYICNESKKIAQAVDETLKTGERVNLLVPVTATVPEKFGDEPVAEFSITLSLKEK